MGELKKWREQNWVRIGTDGAIKGECGTSKNKKNPDRCLPLAKARSLSKKDRSETAKKKKSSNKTVVANTKKAKVRNMENGGAVAETKAKRPFNGKKIPGTMVANGCGVVMSGGNNSRRKRTKLT
tara:strand:- start:31 stop:405 length:375 start_codon:yes stop_codon:yes gene_type:complete